EYLCLASSSSSLRWLASTPWRSRFPYTPLFRSLLRLQAEGQAVGHGVVAVRALEQPVGHRREGHGDHGRALGHALAGAQVERHRSEEHTSELQSREKVVCRPPLDRKEKAERRTS